MNNKNLDKVLNSYDNFKIPKAASQENNALSRFQNLPDSLFAAEAVNHKPKLTVDIPPPAFVNRGGIVQSQTPPPQTPPESFPNRNNVKIEVTKNISNYVPYAEKNQGVKILGDGKIFKKKFSVKIMGVGGAGNNIVRYLAMSEWPDFVDIIALNTDYNALNRISEVKERYIIGHEKLNGNGAGGDPNVAKEVAEVDTETIKKLIAGSDILLLIAGLGKGTGTGAAPVIAKIASEMNVLTIGLFNLPSIGAEGKKIYSNALEGLENLQEVCSGYTAIANDRVIGIDRERTSIKKAYEAANEYFKVIVSEFIDMITVGVDVNIDFSDIKNFFREKNGFIFLKVHVTDYSRDSIKRSIEEAIENGYIDIDIQESGNALYNLKINENVPSIVLENSRAALKEIVKTSDLNVVQGMAFNGSHENAELNIMLSGRFDLGKLSTPPKTYEEVQDKEQVLNLSEPTQMIPDPIMKTSLISQPTSSLDENYSFLSSDPTRKIDSFSQTNAISTKEISENSYLSNQPAISGVGTKKSFKDKILSFFGKK